MRDLVTLDENELKSLVNSPKIAAQIPCLGSAGEKLKNNAKPGCGTCNKERRAKEKSILSEMRNCIRELSPEKVNALKKLLGTRRYRLVIPKSGGGVQKLTF